MTILSDFYYNIFPKDINVGKILSKNIKTSNNYSCFEYLKSQDNFKTDNAQYIWEKKETLPNGLTLYKYIEFIDYRNEPLDNLLKNAIACKISISINRLYQDKNFKIEESIFENQNLYFQKSQNIFSNKTNSLFFIYRTKHFHNFENDINYLFERLNIEAEPFFNKQMKLLANCDICNISQDYFNELDSKILNNYKMGYPSSSIDYDEFKKLIQESKEYSQDNLSKEDIRLIFESYKNKMKNLSLIKI